MQFSAILCLTTYDWFCTDRSQMGPDQECVTLSDMYVVCIPYLRILSYFNDLTNSYRDFNVHSLCISAVELCSNVILSSTGTNKFYKYCHT